MPVKISQRNDPCIEKPLREKVKIFHWNFVNLIIIVRDSISALKLAGPNYKAIVFVYAIG
jgi:hypothetical protein